MFVRTLKVVFHRPRPMAVLDGVRSVRLANVEPQILALAEPLDIRVLEAAVANQVPRSFPSGHGWNAFGIATILAICCRRWGWLAFLPAAAIGIARVHAGVHWPTDVIASAIVAPPCTLGLAFVIERAWLARAPPRWRERLPGILQAPAR
jgi:undecaprenyl-diphosphatase